MKIQSPIPIHSPQTAMNNRYFGNIHDFCKYGLLRLLVKHLSLGVCWMLTPEKKGNSGYEYLQNKNRWWRFDSDLFERLQKWRNKTPQSDWGIHLLEKADPALIDSTRFFGSGEEITANPEQREDYFGRMLEEFKDRKVIFLDPDYGLGVIPEETRGERGNRYLRASEVARCFQNGHSVLFYQHWRRGELGESDPVGRIRAEIRNAKIDARIRVFRPIGDFCKEDDYKASARFFLVEHPDHAEPIGKFVDAFRDSMFSPKPRVGVFVDLDNYHPTISGDSHGAIVHALGRVRSHGEVTDWKRGPTIVGWVFSQSHLSDIAKKLCGETGLEPVIVDYGPEKADIELTDKIRDVVTHGEVDAVIVFATDGDYKMAAGISDKYGVSYYGVGAENQKGGDYAGLCKGFYWVEKEVTKTKGRRKKKGGRWVEFRLKSDR